MNLVVASAGVLALIAAVAAYFVSRTIREGRAERLGISAVVFLAVFLVPAQKYLFPRFPIWVPELPAFKEQQVKCLDDGPLWPSYHVYRAEYSYEGAFEDLCRHIQVQCAGSAEVGEALIADGDEAAGCWRVESRFGPKRRPKLPLGGLLVFHITRERSTPSRFRVVLNLVRNRDM